MCRTLSSLIILVLVLSVTSTSYGLVISDFEGGSLDGWIVADSMLSVSTVGATSGTGALLIEGPGGWHIHGKLDIKALRMALAGEGSTVSIDVTAFAADMVTDWMNMEAIINAQNNDDNGANNNIGWKSLGAKNIVRDGLPQTLTWEVPAELSANIAATDDSILWFELVMVTNNGGATTKLYVDNIRIPDLPAAPAPLGNIILVTEALDVDKDGVRDDQGLEDWLVAQGYAVDVQPGNWMVLDPNKIVALNAADLVLISRATSSGNYDDSAEEIAAWNGITAPMLNLTAYLVRNNRWKWVNSATAPNNTPASLLMAVDPNHPVFAGVVLDADGIADIADPKVGTGLMTYISTLDMGNGKLIAQAIGGAQAWIAEWAAGVEYYAGAGQFAGSKRLLFCAGTQEVGVTPQGALNLNETGLQMLRNAIAYLIAPPKIVLVTEALDLDKDGVRDDQALEDWLVAQGYAVDVQPGNWMVLDPNKIAALNAADLVIISRATSSGNYDDSAEEIAAWNGITAPMLNLTAYLVRNNRWKWVNSGTATNNTPASLLMAVDPNHPVFAGVELDPDGIADILDPTVGTGLMSFIGTLDMGNGTLIALAIGGDLAWIAEWPSGVEYYAGAGQFAGGKRMMFCAGTQEVSGTDTPQGALNLNQTGLQMLDNAIEYLLIETP